MASTLTGVPGMPIGRVDLMHGSVTGFGGEALSRYGVSLGSITYETDARERQGQRSSTRIEGFVLAPPLRGLESLQLRMAMQAMGLKDLRLELRLRGHGGSRARPS